MRGGGEVPFADRAGASDDSGPRGAFASWPRAAADAGPEAAALLAGGLADGCAPSDGAAEWISDAVPEAIG